MLRRASALLLLVTVLGLAVTLGPGNGAEARRGAGAVDGEFIVLLRGDATPAALAARYGLTLDITFDAAVHGFAGDVPPGILVALDHDPDVLSVTPNRVIRAAAPPPGKGPGGGGGSQTVPVNIDRVDAPAMHDQGYTGAGVAIAVFDTGIDLDHPDLTVSPMQFHAEGTGSDCEDGHGHGTHVAGIAAAVDNGTGSLGVAPGATIVCVRVLDATGTGTLAGLIAGIDWLLAEQANFDPPVRVVNASLGELGYVADIEWDPNTPASDPLQAAIRSLRAAGISFIAAAGNAHYVDLDGSLGLFCDILGSGECGDTILPAAFPEATAVASSTATAGTDNCPLFDLIVPADTASDFTTDGSTVVVSAPGEEYEYVDFDCLYLWNMGIQSLSVGGGALVRQAGSSMAAPHAAGVAALLYQKNPGLTPDSVEAALAAGDGVGVLPLDNIASAEFTADGVQEGILSASLALATVPLASGDIHGMVLDDSGAPIAGATVSTDMGDSTTSAADGSYQLSGVMVGDRDVTASASGYESQSQAVAVADGGMATADFALTTAKGKGGGGGGSGPDCEAKPSHPKC